MLHEIIFIVTVIQNKNQLCGQNAELLNITTGSVEVTAVF